MGEPNENDGKNKSDRYADPTGHTRPGADVEGRRLRDGLRYVSQLASG